MSKVVIKAENISKQYRLGLVGTGTVRDDVKRWWYHLRGKEDPFLKIGEANDRSSKGESDYVWSLRDIHFEINQGDSVGIIGRNGAGKSTLLKILSQVTQPTTGKIYAKGRIASLLEVGTGFHPEMTGRENIFLNGAILGMRKHEIARKFDEIVAFSGVERYIDTPVKRYSSGMYVRLAFAVAAHLESEILIVDEVLAVGDAEFQKKCLGKMNDVSKGEGRTVLFVSHNMAAVKSLCNRGILLENGLVKKITNDIEGLVSDYLSGNEKTSELYRTFTIADDYSYNKIVKLDSVSIVSSSNQNYISIKDYLKIIFKFELFKDVNNFNLAVNFKSFVDDVVVFSQITPVLSLNKDSYTSTLEIPKDFLNSKYYSIDLHFVSNSSSILTIENVMNFHVEDVRDGINYYGTWAGYIRPNLIFNIKQNHNEKIF